ncbi:flagellar biosynthetic protein FliS [Thermobacillus composti KWC4]|uniref:Flagellar secretion chaperone FliS n=1 Tax=Thermobacillus composti (strain DSM 18247 / JCM 13945 / KWC4) TaxID=717605 RepID=U3GK41_THECK|nr:flagellar export chaperone FliS [Thermobacillus composti]AGA56409.1 flagellar biosynthetic protein FliS [Thermobacillus composti KWC4]
MLTTPHQIYQQSAVNTSNPLQLIIMLYDGAIKHVKLGIEGIETNDFQKANTHLVKAQSVINELISSLNFQYPIAELLLQIYDYLVRNLIEANVKKQKDPALEVLGHLSNLRDAWQQVAKRGSAAPGYG